MKLAYLKGHNKAQYQQLLIKGQLDEYLRNIDEEANEIYEVLLKQYSEKWGIAEELKEMDQMKWIQEMNNIEKSIEQVICNIMIY